MLGIVCRSTVRERRREFEAESFGVICGRSGMRVVTERFMLRWVSGEWRLGG